MLSKTVDQNQSINQSKKLDVLQRSVRVVKAVTMIFSVDVTFSLSAVGAEMDGVWGWGVPSQKFLHSLFQNGEFLCMPAWISVWYFYRSELCHRQLLTIYRRHDIMNMK